MAKLYKNYEIPKYLLDRRYLLGSVLFILTFSILFMLIYTPFSMTAWFSFKDVEHIGMTVAFYLVAVAFLFISKLAIYAIQQRKNLTFIQYLMWVVAEIVIISLFYTYFTYVFIIPLDDSIWHILFKAFGCILLIMFIPYTIITLYAAYKAKDEELQMLQYEMTLANEPSVTYPSLVNLYDYNGTLKLTINSDSLYYMESQDNYVKIYYENQGKLQSYMLRCRTKTIEESLADTSMVRCHRSFMVNVVNINHIRKEGKSRYIVLTNNSIKPIPVSKSYFKNLIEKIDSCNTSILAKQQKSSEATEPTSEV